MPCWTWRATTCSAVRSMLAGDQARAGAHAGRPESAKGRRYRWCSGRSRKRSAPARFLAGVAAGRSGACRRGCAHRGFAHQTADGNCDAPLLLPSWHHAACGRRPSDRMVKGLAKGDLWDELLQLALRFAKTGDAGSHRQDASAGPPPSPRYHGHGHPDLHARRRPQARASVTADGAKPTPRQESCAALIAAAIERAGGRSFSRRTRSTSTPRARTQAEEAAIDRLTLTARRSPRWPTGCGRSRAARSGRRDLEPALPAVRHPGRADARAARRDRHHLRVAAQRDGGCRRLCLKAGNAAILRGGSEAIHSNQAIAGLRA